MARNTQKSVPSADTQTQHWLDLVRQQVDSLQFGLVQVVVHDSRVVQIERTERLRLEKPAPGTSPLSNPAARPDPDAVADDQTTRFQHS